MSIESTARSGYGSGGCYQIVIGLVQPAQAMSRYLEMLWCKEDFYLVDGGRHIDGTRPKHQSSNILRIVVF